jgi:predicted nucleotidyltransferase
MTYGLTKSEFESIINVFIQTPQVVKAVLFGSRAKGNYKPGSDIDIAIYCTNLLFDDFLALQVKLDELDLLQKIDLVNFNSIENLEFIEHINRIGIIIYKKTEPPN